MGIATRRRRQNQQHSCAVVGDDDGIMHREQHANNVSTSYDNNSPASSPTTTCSKRRLKGSRSGRKQIIVRFAQHDQVYEIPHLDDMSPEQIHDLWIKPSKLKEIKSDAETIITFIEEGGPSLVNVMLDLGDNSISIRGLEQQTPTYLKRKSDMLSLLYDAIQRLQPFKKYYHHAQQQHQEEPQRSFTTTTNVDVDIDKLIADLCIKYTTKSVHAAIQYAKNDYNEAYQQL